MIGQAGWWIQTPSAIPLQPKNEMLIFGLCSTSVDQLGWSMETNPICHTSPAKIRNAHFWIIFNFWWSAWLVNELKQHLPPFSSQNNEMLVLGLHSTSDDQLGWLMHSNPICQLTPAKKWNAHFWTTFNFWWLAGLVDWLKLYLPPMSSQKNEMLIFGLHSTSDDQPGWSMDLNPVLYHSPAKKMKCSILDYVQLLMISQLVDGLKPHLPPDSSQNMKCSFLDYIQLLMISLAGQWTQTRFTTYLQLKQWILIFGLHSNSYDWLGRLMDSNPICHQSPAKKMKCFIFGLRLNFLWSTGMVNGFE